MTKEQTYREALECCYALWSVQRKDCCETADQMADVIQLALEAGRVGKPSEVDILRGQEAAINDLFKH